MAGVVEVPDAWSNHHLIKASREYFAGRNHKSITIIPTSGHACLTALTSPTLGVTPPPQANDPQTSKRWAPPSTALKEH
jgi:hypothetical protein